MVQRGGSDFWVVSCISSGGRPATDISLDLDADEDVQTEANTNSRTQTSSVLLPAVAYQGQNVTCVFDHPKFTHDVQHVMTLPSFCEYRVSHFRKKRKKRNQEDSQEVGVTENTDVLSVSQICLESSCGAQIRESALTSKAMNLQSCRKDRVTPSSACGSLGVCHVIMFPAKGKECMEKFTL